MVLATIRILPSPNRRADVLEILQRIQGPVQTQPGCIACDVYEEQGEEPAIGLVERWESEVALDAHLRSDAYRQILGALELSRSPPEIRFDHVSATEGMDLVERSRRPVGHGQGSEEG